eukprot:scaffold570_cov169-Alexandrium_tamarense.AAC.24
MDGDRFVIPRSNGTVNTTKALPIMTEDEQPEVTSTEQEKEPPNVLLPPAHVANSQAHPLILRYGIPIFLVGTLSLLIASDIADGASAKLETRVEETGEVNGAITLGTISVFTSVKKMWNSESVSTRISIVLLSLVNLTLNGPYVKLVLTLYAWVAPFSWGLCKRGDESAKNPSTLLARMESSLFWLDLLGKWAFVDTFVLIVLMVAFRATISIPLFGTVIEVWVQCHWDGFLFASILSILGTHLVLHLHRRVEREIRQGGGGGSNNNIVTIKNECWEGKQTLISMSSAKAAVVIPVLVLTIVIQILGATTTTFKFTYSGITNFTTEHSLISIGANIPETSRDEDGALIHLLQAFYFILALAVP